MMSLYRWTAILFAMVALLGSRTSSIHAEEASPKRSFLVADSSKGRIAIVGEDGSTQWESKIGPLHDLHQLPNGNLLYQTDWTHLVEYNPTEKKIVWQYDCGKENGNEGKSLEVHAFERLTDGTTMIAESGVSRIIVVDSNGKLTKTIPLQVTKPHPHKDTRLVRTLSSGNFLVCHEQEGLVREYNPQGETVWEYAVPLFDKKPADGHGVEAFGNQCFCALRLESGNTLISTGNGHSVIEVTPKGEIVWHLAQNDLPSIQLAWVTSLQVLPSGNIVLTNCHAGPSNPQIIEVDRNKKVIWSFKDFERFGNSTTNTQILTVDGKPVVK